MSRRVFAIRSGVVGAPDVICETMLLVVADDDDENCESGWLIAVGVAIQYQTGVQTKQRPNNKHPPKWHVIFSRPATPCLRWNLEVETMKTPQLCWDSAPQGWNQANAPVGPDIAKDYGCSTTSTKLRFQTATLNRKSKTYSNTASISQLVDLVS